MLQITNRKALVIWNHGARIAIIPPNRCLGRLKSHFQIARFVIWTSVQIAVRIAMPISYTTSQNNELFWEGSHCLKSLVICDSRFESQIAIAVKSHDLEHLASQACWCKESVWPRLQILVAIEQVWNCIWNCGCNTVESAEQGLTFFPGRFGAFFRTFRFTFLFGIKTFRGNSVLQRCHPKKWLHLAFEKPQSQNLLCFQIAVCKSRTCCKLHRKIIWISQRSWGGEVVSTFPQVQHRCVSGR